MAYPMLSDHHQHNQATCTSPQRFRSAAPRSEAQENFSQAFGGLPSIADYPPAMNSVYDPFDIYMESFNHSSGAMNSPGHSSWMAPSGLQDIQHFDTTSFTPSALQNIQHIDYKDFAPSDNYTHSQASDFDGANSFPTPDSSSSEDDDSSAPAIATPDESVSERSGEAVEPYSTLIYRALMSKPDHSMVLRDIYAWFRENTTRADSSSKGWMNSIRHNLSMNAAFKKTNRKAAGGETKRSAEWVLEPFAVEFGIQSTTRYRQKPAVKKSSKSLEPPGPRRSSCRKSVPSSSKSNAHRVYKYAEVGRPHDVQYQYPTPRSPNLDQTTSPSAYPVYPLNTFVENPYENMVDLGFENVQDAQYLDDSAFHYDQEFFYDGGYTLSPNSHL
ncbi:hypothetical protein BP6252_03806 [Coleophoma cylindrospora]|uniref:Fork-head domain-containing protein n=1 Tax=Coleophoma cylindrospora TaxID=1849047 RepID=A0A3D8S9B8_9HELO|nr:hypothetical protein BP6252_03806 [Coleophoma cylindrospora]